MQMSYTYVCIYAIYAHAYICTYHKTLEIDLSFMQSVLFMVKHIINYTHIIYIYIYIRFTYIPIYRYVCSMLMLLYE